MWIQPIVRLLQRRYAGLGSWVCLHPICHLLPTLMTLQGYPLHVSVGMLVLNPKYSGHNSLARQNQLEYRLGEFHIILRNFDQHSLCSGIPGNVTERQESISASASTCESSAYTGPSSDHTVRRIIHNISLKSPKGPQTSELLVKKLAKFCRRTRYYKVVGYEGKLIQYHTRLSQLLCNSGIDMFTCKDVLCLCILDHRTV